MASAREATCVVVGSGQHYSGAQGFEYFEGISAESAGARGLCLHHLLIPPGAEAQAHLHEHHESAIHVLAGHAEMRFGENLDRQLEAGPGDFVYIPAGMPHQPRNLSSTEPCRALVARTDPNEQESVVLLDEHGRRR